MNYLFDLGISMYPNSRRRDPDELVCDLDFDIFDKFVKELLEKLITIQSVLKELKDSNRTLPYIERVIPFINDIGSTPEAIRVCIDAIIEIAKGSREMKKEMASFVIDVAINIRKYEMDRLFRGTKYGIIIKRLMEISISDAEVKNSFITEPIRQQFTRIVRETMPDQFDRFMKNRDEYIKSIMPAYNRKDTWAANPKKIQPNEKVYWDIKPEYWKRAKRAHIDYTNLQRSWNNDYQRSLIRGGHLIELTFDLEYIYDLLNGYDTLQWYPYMNYDEYVNLYIPLITYAGPKAPYIALVKGFFNGELVNIILYDDTEYTEGAEIFLRLDLKEALDHIKPKYQRNLYFKAVASKQISNAQKFYKIPENTDEQIKSMETAIKEMRIMGSLGIEGVRCNEMRIWTINRSDGLVFMCEPRWCHKLRCSWIQYFDFFRPIHDNEIRNDWKLIPVCNRDGSINTCKCEVDASSLDLDITTVMNERPPEDSLRTTLGMNHIDCYSMEIVCEKVDSPLDIIKIAKTCRAYKCIPDTMRINQMPLTKKARDMFKRVQDEVDSLLEEKYGRVAGEDRQEVVYKLIDEEQPLWYDPYRCSHRTEAFKNILDLVIDHMWNDMKGTPKEE